MALDVTVTTTIRQSTAKVAAYAMDPARERTWITGIRETQVLTPLPLRQGTQVARVAKFAGRSMKYTLEVAEIEPGRRIVMQSVKSPFPMRVTYAFEELAGGTKATLRVQGGPKGLSRLMLPLMAWMVRRNLIKDLRRLKDVTEQKTGLRDGS